MDFEAFRASAEQQLALSVTAVDQFPWENRQAYGLYLKQTEAFVSHSCTLLAGCASRLMEQPALQQRFAEHIAEEAGHEKMAQADMQALGYAPEQLPVLSLTRSFVYSQYYYIHHLNPLTHFGYILFLETLPLRVDATMKRLVECYGKQATCFLRVHAAEDVAHAEKAWALVSEFPEAVLAQVHTNFVESAENYRLLLEQVARQADALVA